MLPTFSIDADPVTNLVVIEMAGFFAPTDVAKFEAARNDAHRRLTCARNQHLTLVDIRAMQIQSQEAVAAFTAILDNAQYASRRLAIVVTQSLARLQIQRAAANRDVRYFANDIDAARAWLLTA